MNKFQNNIIRLWDKYFMNLWEKYPIGVIKSKGQIYKIQEACRITDEVFRGIVQNFNFKTEIELRDYIITEIKKRKLIPSFPPIVSSGTRAGNDIHPQSQDEKLEGFVIIDLGVKYKGFCSDMTRTIFVGVPNEEDKILYQKILNAEELGISNAIVGEKCADLDMKVRESLGDYKKYFIHTLGHGVGRVVHEPPRIYFKSNRSILKENMVITVEPGIYIKGKLGIRIEDTCLITRSGCVPLTKSNKALIVVE